MRFAAQAPIAERPLPWHLALAVPLLLIAAFAGAGGHGRLALTLGVVAVMTWPIFARVHAPKKPSKDTHAVSADASGLTVDGRLVMPRAAITRGYAGTTEEGLAAVFLEGGLLRQACTVFVSSEAEQKALLAALELDGGSRTTVFRALPPWARHLRWLSIVLTASPWVLINVLRLLPAWGWGLVVALYGVVLLPTLLAQQVEVGQDGIFLRWLGNKRFVPFAAIEDVSATEVGVDLALRGGRLMEIRLTQKAGGANAQRDALRTRIKAGVAAQEGLARADEESLLARGARDVETWLRDMRTLGSQEGGYRAAAVPRERLWEVLESPAADPSAREGAAFALHASLDDEERARLRSLTQRTASPRLRVALDGVAREREEARLRVAAESAALELEVDEPEREAVAKAKAGRSQPPR
jgi:hypothetical protein